MRSNFFHSLCSGAVVPSLLPISYFSLKLSCKFCMCCIRLASVSQCSRILCSWFICTCNSRILASWTRFIFCRRSFSASFRWRSKRFYSIMSSFLRLCFSECSRLRCERTLKMFLSSNDGEGSLRWWGLGASMMDFRFWWFWVAIWSRWRKF